MSSFHLAQFNVGRLVAPLESPAIADFVAGLPEINALAEGTSGFVWRYTSGDTNDATADRPYGDDRVIVNLSAWESVEALWDFAYRSVHIEFMRRRREWFETPVEPVTVLWWIPAGTLPTVPEAMDRLATLRANGPSPAAFTFREQHAPQTQAAH